MQIRERLVELLHVGVDLERARRVDRLLVEGKGGGAAGDRARLVEALAPPPREPYALFPRELDGWSSSAQTLRRGIERVLGADDYYSALYTRPGEAAGVDLFLSYYASQTGGA